MKPLILCIFDGYGIAPDSNDNAVTRSHTPFIHSCFKKYPWSYLEASGRQVGLFEGQMGNSEVGHLTIGAGRIVQQSLTRISEDAESGVLQKNPVLLQALEKVKKNQSTLHLFALLGDGGVHAHHAHLVAFLEAAKENNITNVVIHLFTDGRDTDPKSGYGFLQILLKDLKKIGIGHIGSIGGRYYGMDRDKRWERTEKAWHVIVQGHGSITPLEYIQSQYDENITDEFMIPTALSGYEGMKDNDVLLFTNFRADRMRQIVRSFIEKDFSEFDVSLRPKNLSVYLMTMYEKNFNVDGILYPLPKVTDTLSEVLAKNNISQLHIAETEKYAHVTFFLNGGREEKYVKEDWIIIPSQKVASYDLKPEMSAREITEVVIDTLKKKKKDVIIMNFANPDMVGHTGDMSAVKKALECVDECFQRIVEEVLSQDGILLLTADHGNAEDMETEKGTPMTAHTVNKVPFMIISHTPYILKKEGTLSDITPTILDILKIEKDKKMTGESLVG